MTEEEAIWQAVSMLIKFSSEKSNALFPPQKASNKNM